MPRILIGTSLLLLTLSLVFSFLNTNKIKLLRHQLAEMSSARDVAIAAQAESAQKLKSREAELTTANKKATAAEQEKSSAQAELSKAQYGKAELATKLQASEDQVADLQKRIAEATIAAGAEGEGGSPKELKAQLEESRKGFQAAEREKIGLEEKLKAARDRLAAMEEEKKLRESKNSRAGVRGTVLAVNQAYNFVVLGIGERQGVVPNSELLVLRNGALIGKVRISSVEPTTSIGDIITNSLARGVQLQPGDTVVYAGSTNS